MSDSNHHTESIPVGDRVSMFLRGKVWYANYQANGKQHRPSLKTRIKREALLRAQRIEADLAQGDAPVRATVASIGEAIDAFLAWHETDGRSSGTMKIYRRVMNTVRVLAGSRRMSLVTHLDFAFADALKANAKAAGNQPKTIYVKLIILRSLVRFAFRRKMTPTDPLEGYKIKKVKARPQPCWSWEDAQRILDASPACWRPLFTFLRETGCRIGEAMHLTWADLKLEAEQPYVHIRAKEGWRPKTGDERKVPLTGRASNTLGGLPKRGLWVFEYDRKRRTRGRARVSHHAAHWAIKQVLKRLGLPGKLHTFRHTFISHALLTTPEPVVRKWVGHVDADTIRLYTHVSDTLSSNYMTGL